MDDKIRQLLNRPNFAHLSTLTADGSPQNAPVWVALDGDRVVFATGENTLKAKNLRKDPRFALSIVDLQNPYEEAQLRGRAVEFRDDSDFAVMDAISHKYTGKPFPWRTPEGRVAIYLEVEKERYAKLPFEPPRGL